ncbi:MAG: type II CAAX endopeptidase family protein [Gudongella sp.]|nr:type II CAAX endopeptidase family protein [Gudongella sp.]
MIRRELPTVNNVNILFLIVGILLLVVGASAQRYNLYSGILITEYLLILLPNIAFLKFKKFSLKKVLKLNRLSLKQMIFIFFIMLFAYPVAVFLNFIMLAMVTSISEAMPIGVPIPDNFTDYILGLFVVAITPGICEEVMFRGTLQNAYSKFGEKKGLIITSILFGIFHFNLLNLLGPIFLGIVLGIILIKTNSLYGSILGHILNNGFAMTIGYLLLKLTKNLELLTKDVPLIDNSIQMVLTAVILASLALFSFIGLYILLKNLPVTKSEELDILEENEDLDLMKDEIVSFEETIEINERIMWSPIVIIAGIFIYSNWIYFFY